MNKIKNFLSDMYQWFAKYVGPWWHRFQLTRWLVIVILALILVVSSVGIYGAKTTDVGHLETRLRNSTAIYDSKNKKAGAIAGQKGTYVSYKKISSHMIDAVLSTEDRNFYKEPGFSVTGMTRGVLRTIWYRLNGSHASAGGSTLTQQLVKNAFLSQNQTISRKFRELFLAIQVEKVYTKNQILTMYLNNAYFGEGVWGVEDAAQKYFGVSAQNLSITQAAMLTGMLQAPNSYNPLSDGTRTAALNRRNQVLLNMVANNKLSESNAKTLQATSIGASNHELTNSNYHYPYYFDAVIDEAINKYGLTESEIMNNGYKIYTTLDQTDQTNLQNDVANQSLNVIGGDSQLASVVLDAKTGGVRAVVGGRGSHVFRGLNRATQMKRQPGSTMKPIVAYAPSLSHGYSYDSLLKNKTMSFGSNKYTPTNDYGITTEPITMYKALENSYNIPAVWLLDQIGVSTGYDAAKKLGLPLKKSDKNLALALGGLESGVSPIQLAQAYTSFANNGVMSESHFITKIVDASGKTVGEAKVKQTRVWSKKVANEMTSMMLGVYTNGTGVTGKPSSYQVAGKTGTTESTTVNNRATDAWGVAYTPDVVTVTWSGYDSNSNTIPVGMANTIGPFVKRMLTQVVANTDQTKFTVNNIESTIADEAANEKAANSSQNADDSLSEGVSEVWNTVKDGASSAWSNIKGLFGNG